LPAQDENTERDSTKDHSANNLICFRHLERGGKEKHTGTLECYVCAKVITHWIW